MQPILIGYFPRQTAVPKLRPALPPHVQELCNVGSCAGCAPEDWVHVWLHNQFWVYDTEMLAWGVALQTANLRRLHDELARTWDGVRGSVQRALRKYIEQHVPPPATGAEWASSTPRWQVLAYCLYPNVFVPGGVVPIEFPSLEVEPLPADYERLGYDPVSVPTPEPGYEGLRGNFAHSSLSPFCNGLCGNIPVNRFCLLDTEAEGLRRAEEFANGGGEPEPYALVEVWRKRWPASAPENRDPAPGA